MGRGLLAKRAGALIRPLLAQPRVFIVTDSNVAPLYLDRLAGTLRAGGIRCDHVIVPAGEASKDMTCLATVLNAMLAARCERSTMIVALGGGVVGDRAGFAASILLRGVEFIQVPTTLLAQVDSSVGGKTGINMPAGKNLVGTFHQPRLVLADTDVLATLPRRELLAGYAEVAKYGLIDDVPFWHWLEQNGADAIGGGPNSAAVLRHCIVTSCRAKARIVAADEREGGVRALLNLGHTFAHALEEPRPATAIALLHMARPSPSAWCWRSICPRASACAPASRTPRVVRDHLAQRRPARDAAARRTARTDHHAARLIALHMGQDKKVQDGAIIFILARGIGQAFTSTAAAPRPPWSKPRWRTLR